MTKIILTSLLLVSVMAQAKPAKTFTPQQVYNYMTGGQAVDSDTKQSVERHFRDSNKFYPDPTTLSQYPMPKNHVIRGSNYMVTPLLPWNYKFDVYNDKGTMVIRTKIHFKDTSGVEIRRMQQLIKGAEDIWNKDAPQVLAFKYRFKFVVVKNAEDGYISVGMLNDTRGPFFSNWSRTWGSVSIAHEIGHMMGLSDEYNEMTGDFEKINCDTGSLMCNGWWGEPKGFHYYHILRKVLQP